MWSNIRLAVFRFLRHVPASETTSKGSNIPKEPLSVPKATRLGDSAWLTAVYDSVPEFSRSACGNSRSWNNAAGVVYGGKKSAKIFPRYIKEPVPNVEVPLRFLEKRRAKGGGTIRSYLGDPEEVEYLGTEDYFLPTNICIVEWANLGKGNIPAPDLTIALETQGTGRQLSCQIHSEKGQKIAKRLWQ